MDESTKQLTRQLYEAFLALGLTESQALKAAGGRDNRFLKLADIERPISEGEKNVMKAFQRMGLSESTAKLAASIRYESMELKDNSSETGEYEGKLTEKECQQILDHSIALSEIKIRGGW